MLTLPIQAGKTYKTRDGRKVTCISAFDHTAKFSEHQNLTWVDTGTNSKIIPNDPWDLVDDWNSPVREVTRKEIVPGVYGRIKILNSDMENNAYLWFDHPEDGDRKLYHFTANELREAAKVFVQLADALD